MDASLRESPRDGRQGGGECTFKCFLVLNTSKRAFKVKLVKCFIFTKGKQKKKVL